MSEIADLLDDTTQTAFREALELDARSQTGDPETRTGEDVSAEGTPRPETLAALAVLGRQAAEIRPATLTLMTAGIRFELQAFGYAAPTDDADVRWRLTDEGGRAAEVLAATVTPSVEERERAARDLSSLLDQVREELGGID